MANTILNYLVMVSNNNLLVNLLMHLVVLTALGAVFLVKSEALKRCLFMSCISILFMSVTIHGLVFGNIFHVITFGIMAVAALVQLFFNKQAIKVANSSARIAITLLFILIGLWYPEFISKNMIQLLVISPVGIIPCPTLLATLGLMTLVYPSTGRVIYAITIFMGFVYGIIGTFVFKVYLDALLLGLAIFAVYILFTATKTVDQKYLA